MATRRLLVLTAALACFGLVGGGLAQTTALDALSYRAPEVDDALTDLDFAERDLAWFRLIESSAALSSAATWSDSLEDEDPLDFAASNTLELDLGYSYNPVQLFAEWYQIEAARVDVVTAQRRGVRDALRAQADLERAKLRVEDRERRVNADRDRLEQARQAFEAGEASTLEVEEARLSLASEERILDRERANAAELREQVVEFGLDPSEFDYLPIRFELPEIAGEETLRAKGLEYAIVRADDAVLQRGVLGVVRNVNLVGTYVQSDLEMRGQVGLESGRPRVEAGLEWPGGNTDRWSLRLSASIVLNRNLYDWEEFEAEAAAAADDLDAYLAQFPDDLADARDDVAYEEEGLAIAEDRLALSEDVLALAESELAAARDRLIDSEPGSEERAAAERALEAAATSLDRATDRRRSAWSSVLVGWIRYVQNVERYLALAEADWQVADSGQ